MKKRSGFTLIELLVVVAIIAILSVIGLVAFTSVQTNARDARRRADIDAIAKALEANKDPGSSKYTTSLANSQFVGGTIPTDSGNGIFKYCAAIGMASVTTWISDCPPAAELSIWFTVSPSWPVVSAAMGSASWIVCARLESSTGTTTATGLKVYCKSSTQ